MSSKTFSADNGSGNNCVSGDNSTLIVEQLPQSVLDLISSYRKSELILMERYINLTEKYINSTERYISIIAELRKQIVEKDNIIKHFLGTKAETINI